MWRTSRRSIRASAAGTVDGIGCGTLRATASRIAAGVSWRCCRNRWPAVPISRAMIESRLPALGWQATFLRVMGHKKLSETLPTQVPSMAISELGSICERFSPDADSADCGSLMQQHALDNPPSLESRRQLDRGQAGELVRGHERPVGLCSGVGRPGGSRRSAGPSNVPFSDPAAVYESVGPEIVQSELRSVRCQREESARA